MHDPMSVAFQIPNPFATRYSWAKRWSQRPSLVTIWHRDPERGGRDDSCWHAYNFRKLTPHEETIVELMWDGETMFDNRPHYPDSREHKWFQQLKTAWLEHSRRRSFWRIPWRWHFWHWRIQIEPLVDVKRWLFSRCETCGKRFPYGYAPVSGDWNATGPRWFRSEKGVRHHECARHYLATTAKT